MRPWVAPDRLHPLESAERAATGKLLANLSLAISAQGLREALALGASLGASSDEVLTMLRGTGLDSMAALKGAFVRGERNVEEGDFTVDALAKDVGLMLEAVAAVPANARATLPALAATLGSLADEQSHGHGSYDFSAIDRGHPKVEG